MKKTQDYTAHVRVNQVDDAREITVVLINERVGFAVEKEPWAEQWKIHFQHEHVSERAMAFIQHKAQATPARPEDITDTIRRLRAEENRLSEIECGKGISSRMLHGVVNPKSGV